MSWAGWREYLPATFSWVDNCKHNLAVDVVPGAWHVLVLKEKEDGKFSLDAPQLDKEWQDKVLDALKSYSGVLDTLPMVVGEASFILHKVSKLDLSPKQKALQFGLELGGALKKLRVKDVVLVGGSDLSALDMYEGLAQGLYSLGGFRDDEEKTSLPQSVGIMDDKVQENLWQERRYLVQSLALSRMLGDSPANFLTPERFAAVARDIAGENLQVEVKGRAEIQELGMGAFSAVAQGSPLDPQMIVLKAAGTGKGKVALVGKGLTFDAGGVSLKPAPGMDEMKYDMCGGAAVLGAMYYLSKVPPTPTVIGVIGAVENVLDGKSVKPGDVVKAYNGKTIEILNTDAEGRLVLADLLSYACKEWQPNLIIDVATLTGAALIALGSCGAAVMSSKAELAEKMRTLAASQGENLWPLPFWPELTKELRSDVADLKNIAASNVKAGTIIAGMFLQEFVSEGTAWAHLDIAGTAWNAAGSGMPRSGGSGFSVKTMLEACYNLDSIPA